jgi:hypothetical protein
MIAAQISVILRKAGFKKSGYAPGQRIRLRRTEGYAVRTIWDVVRVDYTPAPDQVRNGPEAARATRGEMLNKYRQAIEAAGFRVETKDTGAVQYLEVTEQQERTP